MSPLDRFVRRVFRRPISYTVTLEESWRADRDAAADVMSADLDRHVWAGPVSQLPVPASSAQRITAAELADDEQSADHKDATAKVQRFGSKFPR